MNIFISCGEPSGDLYAADFAKELIKINNNLNIWGMYGPKTEKILKLRPHWSYEALKLMGFLEVLPAIPRIVKLRHNIIQEILLREPDAVVLIDCPDFNLFLASGLRKAGFKNKIISLIPPTVWAWREGRVKNLKRDFDLCLPLFKFEHEFLIAHNVNSLWAAHPLVASISDFTANFNAEKILNKFNNNKIIALMPGSRRYDIKFHLDTLINTAKILKHDNYLPVFSIAPGLSPNLANELRERVSANKFEYWDGEGRELMAAAQAVAGVSGTVAVEAMLLKRFMTVIYNLNKFTYFMLKRLVKAKYISTPNYMTSQQIFPELLCGAAKPERIVHELYNYLNNKNIKDNIDGLLERAQLSMGDKNAAEFWAQCVLNLI